MVDLLGKDKVVEDWFSLISAKIILFEVGGLELATTQCSGKVRSSHLIV